MAEPLQYSKNGKCRFENYPECLNNPNEIDMGIMDKNGIYMKWFMGLERVSDPEGDRFRAYIRSEFRNENARISFFVLFKFSKFGRRCASRGKHKKGTNGTVYSGHRLKISEFVNRPNEWLSNGALEIEYGIHLEALGGWNLEFQFS